MPAHTASTVSNVARQHAEWLSLLEINGPFLSLETLLDVFPQGIVHADAELRRRLRMVYDEWQDNQQGLAPDPAIHAAWVRYVLTRVLDLPEAAVVGGAALPAGLAVTLAEYGETVAADLALLDPNDGRVRLAVLIVPAGQGLESDLAGRLWKASPAARLQALLKARGLALGLVTNGEQWMLVHCLPEAAAAGATGYISWYAHLWLEEPITLQAWISLLGVYRWFGVPDSLTLEALLRRSAEEQAGVTDQLGYQVRRAVELLVRAIDVADHDAGAQLLQGVSEGELYEAALTVMMRLVLLFAAEERGLFPLDDELYAEHYAATPLRAQLREAADAHGEQVIEQRSDAWRRLLALFRAIHGGVVHDRLRLPAYGSSLFDPDRFPFLEGRRPGTSWTTTPAQPLPLNNRTVLHLLEALQLLQVKAPGGERQTRRLSFRALDIEQIGHVYEGLLDHRAVRAGEVVLGLAGAKDQEPETALAALEAAAGGRPAAAPKALLDLLQQETGRSAAALQRSLAAPVDPAWLGRLLAACGGDGALLARVRPYANLVRADDLEQPIVILPGSVYVTAGAGRRATGTHYTPRTLTEPIVQHTLEPLVYRGPAEGLPRERWQLRPAAELLELKVCDMAMGSGAFLVQACRYLADRLLEALDREAAGPRRAAPPRRAGKQPAADATHETLAAVAAAAEAEERTVLARRLVAERCLYGVDKNPLAVEMAKLSLWLITLDKGRAFNFLDHALKEGDSLVGIHSLDQLRCWNLAGSGARPFGALEMEVIVDKMIRARRQIEALPVRDIEDQQLKGYLLADAEAIAHDLKGAADMLIAGYYNTLGRGPQAALREALLHAAREGADLAPEWRAAADLGELRPFHWPLEFPEVFLGEGRTGFDAFVGNPPFIGGKRIREALGDAYRGILPELFPGSEGGADLCAFFFLRAAQLFNEVGILGLVATNSIAQGDTRTTGLAAICDNGGVIFRAQTDLRWPGQAAVVVDVVHIACCAVAAPYWLNGQPVGAISSYLNDHNLQGQPFTLVANEGTSFIGSFVNGMGFVLEPSEAEELIARNPRNREVLFPYLNGEDLNSHPAQQPSRWVINFFDWPRERTAPGSWLALDEKAQRHAAREGVVPADYPGTVAADYDECLQIIVKRVLPMRQEVNREAHRKYWWHYGDKRPALYGAIRSLKRVLVKSCVAGKFAWAFVPNGLVYNHSMVVVANDDIKMYSMLQSSIHETWARSYASSLKMDMRYTPSDCLENYPLPQLVTSKLDDIGGQYMEHRRQLMLDRQEGLTATYNRFHDPNEHSADIERLRELHVAMDAAVAAAYGWGELGLGHGFHATAQGLRFTLSEAARREVLRRLLALNHARHAEEVAQGRQEKKGRGARGEGRSGPGREEGQLGLF